MNLIPVKLRVINIDRDVILFSVNKVKHRRIGHPCLVTDVFNKDNTARNSNSAVTPFP